MDSIAEKREQEKKTVSFMIELYCQKNHKTKKGCLCENCIQLSDYALARISHCPHMKTKTFCSSCKTHCYKPAMREKIRKVMRYSGPRMIFYHPVLAIKHVIETIKGKRDSQ